jgi:hypothetical protein
MGWGRVHNHRLRTTADPSLTLSFEGMVVLHGMEGLVADGGLEGWMLTFRGICGYSFFAFIALNRRPRSKWHTFTPTMQSIAVQGLIEQTSRSR